MMADMTQPGVPWIDYLPDNADEALAMFPSMPGPCAACPAIEGTEANLYSITKRKFDECVSARCAFWCHLTVTMPSFELDAAVSPAQLCGGWKQAVGATAPNPTRLAAQIGLDDAGERRGA